MRILDFLSILAKDSLKIETELFLLFPILHKKNWVLPNTLSVLVVPAFYVFHDLVHKWGLRTKEKLKLTFSWSLLKYHILKSLLHILAVLGYLPKLRKVMGLVSSVDFLHTFCIKIFLIKCPVKWPSSSIWGEWPKGSVRIWIRIGMFLVQTPLGTQMLFKCLTANFEPLPKGLPH